MAHDRRTGERFWIASNDPRREETVWHAADGFETVSEKDGHIMWRYESAICGASMGSAWGRSKLTELPSDSRICRKCERVICR